MKKLATNLFVAVGVIAMTITFIFLGEDAMDDIETRKHGR